MRRIWLLLSLNRHRILTVRNVTDSSQGGPCVSAIKNRLKVSNIAPSHPFSRLSTCQRTVCTLISNWNQPVNSSKRYHPAATVSHFSTPSEKCSQNSWQVSTSVADISHHYSYRKLYYENTSCISFDSLKLTESDRRFCAFISPDPDNPNTYATFGYSRFPQAVELL